MVYSRNSTIIVMEALEAKASPKAGERFCQK